MKLLVNAKIFPSNKSQSILINKNKIIFIGDRKEINISLNASDIINCNNNTVLPGFIDGHCHPFEIVSNMSSIDLSDCQFNSKNEIRNYLKNINTKNKKILKFHGFEHRNINSQLDLRFFDNLKIDIPLIIKHRTGHLVFLNTLALKNSKIDINNYDFPINSLAIHKKLSLEENLDFEENLENYSQDLLEYGYTTIVDAGVGNDMEKYNKYKDLIYSNRLSSNVCYMLGQNNINQFKNATTNDNLYLGPSKFMFQENTAIQEIENSLKDFLSINKNDIAFHAISSEMIFKILYTLFEKLNEYLAQRIIRLEHATEFIADSYKEYSSRNLHLIFNPNFIYDHGDFYINHQDDFDIESLFGIKDSLRNNFKIGFGTDSPFGSIDPMKIIASAKNRATKNNNLIGVNNKINFKQIINALTKNNAIAINKKKVIGSIEAGKNADIIILNNQITETTNTDDIQVNYTIINGESKYIREIN